MTDRDAFLRGIAFACSFVMIGLALAAAWGQSPGCIPLGLFSLFLMHVGRVP